MQTSNAHSLASIEIGMSPNLVDSGGVTITWHSFFMLVAVLAAIWLAVRWGREGRVGEGMVAETALWAVVGGIIGARLVHVFDNWDFYTDNPSQIFRIWNGGIAVFGAFAGGVIGGGIFALANRLPVRYMLDVAAPTMILGQAIGRVGDIINGEHFSDPSDLPWAVVYTHPESPGFGVPPSHPAVAYEMFADIALFAILLALRGRLKPHGALFGLTALAYAVIRLGFAPLRLDSNSEIAGINQQGFIAIVVLVLAAAWLVYLRPRFGARSIAAPEGFAEPAKVSEAG